MMLRCAAVRDGRRTLATALPRSVCRRATTDAGTNTDANASSGGTEPKPMPFLGNRKFGQAPKLPQTRKKKKQKAAQEAFVSLAAGELRSHRDLSWTRSRKVGNMMVTPAQQYAEFQHIRWQQRGLGSEVVKRFVPSDLINKPPASEDVTLELLMASQTHMGHHTSLWNPANSRYIYGVREGIHIISLETTAAHLRRAARVVEEVLYRGGLVLFAGTRLGHMEIVVKAAEMASACYLFTKWTPGSITNRDVILKTHPIKVVDHHDKELPGFGNFVTSTRPLTPSLVVCLNPRENFTLLYECSLKNIPTIGVIDTDADPSWVTYTIPSNDDSLRAMAVVGGVLGNAGQKGTKRRLEEAAQGQVTWKTPPELTRHINKEIGDAKTKQKEVMKMMQDDVEDFNEEEQQLLRRKRQAEARGQVDEEAMLDLLGGTGGREASAAASAFVANDRPPKATA